MSRIVSRREIEKELAEELGIPLEEVSKATHSQFQFVAQTMRKGKLEQVRLPYFGRFYVHPKRKEKFYEDREMDKQNA